MGEAMSRIAGPSDTRHGDIPVGVEVQPGKTTGQLKVFDTGVSTFPDTSGGGASGFTPISLDSTITASLNDWITNGRTRSTSAVHIVAKRSITLLADSGNGGTIYVGDAATSATGPVGFPLSAGATLTLEITHGSEIFLAASAATQTLYWIAV